MLLSLSAIALWFGLAVCPAPAHTTAAPILRGQVLDAENKPLAGATVMVNETGAHQTTDGDGRFALVVEPQARTISVSQHGETLAAAIALATIPTGVIRVAAAPKTIGRANAVRTTLGAGQVATSSRVGLLGQRNVFDTPFTTNTYTDQLIANQQARSLTDVIDNDVAVRAAANAYSDTEEFAIRGFPLYISSTTFDGLPGLVDYRRPALDGIARVEVFQGPTALLGNTVGPAVGGTINMVPKRAEDQPTFAFTASGLPLGDGEFQVDAGQRFGAGNAFGVRVNLAAQSGATPIANQHEDFGIQTAALDYRDARTTVSFDYSHQQRTLLAEESTFSVLPGFAVPTAPPAASNIFDRSTTFAKSSAFSRCKPINTSGVGSMSSPLTAVTTARSSTPDHMRRRSPTPPATRR
jgi:outer membrane receptor for monomeric catechols